MKRWFFSLFLLFSSIFAKADAGTPKYALVIGNGDYSSLSRLANPVNDADDMTLALEYLGFAVDKVLNGSLDQMESAVTRLRDRLAESKDAYGFFFYAGHGVQSSGENYLIPVNTNIPSESYLRERALSVQIILDDLNQAGNNLNVVVLDACRDNPFSWKRSGSRGLSVVSYQPADSIVVYATSAGSTAADGSGRNGLFTGYLLNHLKTPGLEVTEVFRLTMGDVASNSRNEQRPAVYNQFYGTAYLGASTAQDASSSYPVPMPLPSQSDNSRTEKARTGDAASRLWTVGVCAGSSFAAPWVIAAVHGTIAPFDYSFLKIGFDVGFISGASDAEYYSLYPSIHYAYFRPFPQKGGLYAGAGAGYMISMYSFPGGDYEPKSFAADLIAGVNLFDMLDISYSFRTNFKNVSNKVSVGYTYRFKYIP